MTTAQAKLETHIIPSYNLGTRGILESTARDIRPPTMKKRAVLIGALLFVAVGVLFWLRVLRDEIMPPASEPLKPGAVQSANPPSTGSQKLQQGTAAQQPAEKLPPPEQRRAIINAWEQAREKEVEFWGKVIDQQDEPVPSVAVTATITTHQLPQSGFKPQPTTIYSATTDAAGMFYIKGRIGRGFTIETMQRVGYVLPPELQKRRGNLFWYNYDQLDPKGFKPAGSAPIVFRMWKLGQPEKLVVQDRDIRIPYDGTSVTIDLLSGEQVATGGDIRVTLKRTPLQITRGQQKYDWSATIEPIDGGVLATNDEFMYRAPETGYESKLTVSVLTSDPHWSPDKKVSFFLKSRAEKHYGHVVLRFMTDSEKPKTGFSFQSFINPTGSRNLEFDPKQSVNVGNTSDNSTGTGR